jgi:DNA-binding response OmpR family regulator
MAKILLVEDDDVLAETLQYNLKRAGYETLATGNGATGLHMARSAHPDLIILDIMLPDLDGLSICRILRGETTVPIIILTARRDDVDRLAGFEMGADDYVVKPFHLGELLARIRAILRRNRPVVDPGQRELFGAANLRVDTGSRRAFRGDTELILSQRAFDLLVCLIRNRGLALSRDLLIERVWGWEFMGDPRTVDVHIRWLREKVEVNPSQPRYIQTVRGIGYRFDGS